MDYGVKAYRGWLGRSMPDGSRIEGPKPVKIFESAAPAVVPQTTLTVQQKKIQILRRCNWDLFHVYDFMFM